MLHMFSSIYLSVVRCLKKFLRFKFHSGRWDLHFSSTSHHPPSLLPAFFFLFYFYPFFYLIRPISSLMLSFHLLSKKNVFSLYPRKRFLSVFSVEHLSSWLFFFFLQSSLLVYFKCRKAVNVKQKTREKRRGGRTTKLGEAFRVRFSVNLSTL